MNQIINHLYIGSFEDAKNSKQLYDNNIRHVINVAEECDHTKFCNNINYEKYPIIEYFKSVKEDDVYDLNYANLEKIYKILDKYIEKEENILIHCAHGMSRSVSFVVYYLMKKYHMDAEESLKFVRTKRPIAYPCHDYVKYLTKRLPKMYNFM